MKQDKSNAFVLRQKKLILVLLVLFISACGGGNRIEKSASLHGETMGTTWSVVVPELPAGLDQVSLQAKIDGRLKNLDQMLSTYIEGSALSHLNQSTSTDWFEVPGEVLQLVTIARTIMKLTGGAYDPTIGPVIDLWGFGPGKPPNAEMPDHKAIDDAMKTVGIDKLELRESRAAIRKGNPRTRLDLSSIAKGFAVDEVGEILEHDGVENYLVEIGGELRTRGLSPRSDAWRIGIEKPGTEEPSVLQALRFTDANIATSGDYRNFFEIDGVRYSHAIDARSGRPVTHALSSVTVFHETTTEADAWATALLVLGEEEGFTVAKANRIAAFFVFRSDDDFVTKHTEPFTVYLEK